MQSLMRFVCIGYLIFLTVLLLVADPLRFVSVHGQTPGVLRMLLPWAHFLSFFVLVGLALTARWPVPRWAIAVFLVLYAGMTEVAQSLMPPRTAEWGDWLQDVIGIAVGASLCWMTAAIADTWTKTTSQPGAGDSPGLSEELEVVRALMSRPGARGQSWWK